jgi:hypothetical protein
MWPISIVPCSGVMRRYEATPAGLSSGSFVIVRKSGSSECAVSSSRARSAAASA